MVKNQLSKKKIALFSALILLFVALLVVTAKFIQYNNNERPIIDDLAKEVGLVVFPNENFPVVDAEMENFALALFLYVKEFNEYPKGSTSTRKSFPP